MSIKYIHASELDFDPRPQMGEIFAEGFAHLFTGFSKDTKLLAKAFAHVFDLKYFYLAVEDNVVAAMAACTNGFSPIKFDKKICRKELGFIQGSLAHSALTKYIVNHKFPLDFTPNMGRVEIVGTATAFRGKGIAYRLLTHMMESEPYSEYVLEVLDDNAGAIKLYEKLGFETFDKVKFSVNKTSFLYMKCKKVSNA